MAKRMFKAIHGALSLAALIIVLQLFLPEVYASVVTLIIKVLTLANVGLDQASTGLPR
jgi:hypothetical protein